MEIVADKLALDRARETGGRAGRPRILAVMPCIPLQGMERANIQIMKLLHSRGAQVCFVTEKNYGEVVRREVERAGFGWADASLITRIEETLHLTKNVGEMAVVVRAWARAAWQIRRIIREYCPTHVHITNITFFLYLLPLLLGAKFRVVFRLPNPPATDLPGYKQRLSNLVWRRCVIPLCDVIVCNSQHTLRQLKAVGVNTSKAVVIYNSLPARESFTVSDAPRLDPRRFNIVYVGRVTPKKGAAELYQAALRLMRERDDVDFYLAGEYEWQNPFADALVAEVKARGLDSRFHFLGELDDIFGLLAQSDLHVFPSHTEGFGLVVLEAKSVGVPSVVFPSGGLMETVEHKVDGYVCREVSWEALYEGIKYFLDDPQALAAAGEAARASLARFSEEKVGEQWGRVFDVPAAQEA